MTKTKACDRTYELFAMMCIATGLSDRSHNPVKISNVEAAGLSSAVTLLIEEILINMADEEGCKETLAEFPDRFSTMVAGYGDRPITIQVIVRKARIE